MAHDTDGYASSWPARRSDADRQLAEAPFRLFVECVQDYAIFMLDPDGRIISWNTGAERIMGYREGEVLGRHFSVVFTPDGRRHGHPDEELAIARRDGRYEVEAWRVRKDGSRFWANVVITAVFDERGQLVGFGKVTRDLTERRRQEEHAARLRQEQAARAEAEAASRVKSQVLAAVSHELRAPLNAIIGYVDLMELGLQGPLTAEQQRSLQRIRRSGQHLLAQINDVLNFARVEAGRVEYDITDVPLREAFAAVEPFIGPQLAAKGIEFRPVHCAPGTALRADAAKLQQILLNLLTNACKFTEPGGRVTLECEEDGGWVRVRVRDTGRGIPADRLEAIFEPFVQIDRHLLHIGQQGVGLGLAISRDLARAMGGDLTVESVVGAGSTFTLSLPRVREAEGGGE